MSTNQEGNAASASEVEIEKIPVSRKVLSVTSFEDVLLTGEAIHTPVTSIEEFLTRFPSSEAALKALNLGLRRDTVLNARNSLGVGDPQFIGNNKSVAMFLSSFAASPKFEGIANKAERRKAVLKHVSKNAGLLAAVRAMAAVEDDDGEESASEPAE
jgi:hypothetical protein